RRHLSSGADRRSPLHPMAVRARQGRSLRIRRAAGRSLGIALLARAAAGTARSLRGVDERMIPEVLGRLRQRMLDPHARRSYAQSGEDLIVRHLLLEVLGRREVRYLDVGAHDPWFLSNTALFYRMGFSGVLVEPDALLCRNLRRHRARDLC